MAKATPKAKARAKARAKAKSRSTVRSSATNSQGVAKNSARARAQGPGPGAHSPHKGFHIKYMTHMILLNNVFMWLLQSHDLFRGADAIRWLVEIDGMHTSTNMVAKFVFFCPKTVSTVTRMERNSIYPTRVHEGSAGTILDCVDQL